MSDGDLRRPPRLPMQALSERIAGLTVGLPSSTVASLVPSDPLPAPGGTGSDPEPPAYADITAAAPASATVAQVIAGLAVTWGGLDTASNVYPPGVYAEVHASTTSGFTPSAATLKGTLSRPGTFTVTGLTAGTGYYVRLVIVDEAGQTATSAQVGPVTAGFVTSTAIGVGTITPDLVSFDATAIGGIQQYVGTGTPPTTGAVGSTWVNTGNGSYNVLELVSSVKTWVQRQWSGGGIAADSISTVQLAAGAVTAENILAQAITTKLVNGEVIRTTTDDTGARVRLSSTDGIEVYSSVERVFHAKPDGTVTVKGAITSGSTVSGATITGSTVSTGTTGTRVEMQSGALADRISFYDSGSLTCSIIGGSGTSNSGIIIDGQVRLNGLLRMYSGTDDFKIMRGNSLDLGYFNVQNVYDYTTATAANVVVGSNGRILRSTSRAAEKYRIVPLTGEFVDVPADKIAAPEADGAVDMYDVLRLAPAQYARLEDEYATDEQSAPERTYLGFIAEDVAAKFPVAAEWDANGQPDSYDVRAIVSALLGVVAEQQAAITDLTARLEALEA